MQAEETVADRETFIRHIEQLVKQSGDNGDPQPFALILVKLDHFRKFNAQHGFSSGDALLSAFSSCLLAIKRPQDYLARVGNAEFALLLSGVSHEGFANLAATKLFEVLKNPLSAGGQSIPVQAHSGIVLFPQHGGDAQILLRRAESAMDAAKKTLQPYAVFQQEDSKEEIADWGIQYDLSRAIEQDQFELYFQPQINLESGELFGAEALIRWQNGDKGFIRPDIFIPIAEKSGQIAEITEWTLNSALWFIEDWCRHYSPINVAVNISTRMLDVPDFKDVVHHTVNLHGIDYHHLTLEITESALVENLASSVTVLEDLKQLGVNVSIDDFGTGYSSLAYFKELPANEIKIDRSFVQYMLENAMDQHIVKTIIHLAHGFDLTVVAEGIEDKASYDYLRQVGCNIAQGYYIAKPMPREEFLSWANENFSNLRL